MSTQATKPFHIGDVLSITTGRMLAPEGVGAIYKILNFMTQDTLFSHQIPRVCDECKPFLLRQFPALASVDATGVTPENHKAWLLDQVLQHGEFLQVAQLAEGEHYYIDPVSELAEKVHPSRIVLIPKI